MKLQNLQLTNFKNYETLNTRLDNRPDIICIVGNNGSGKTNLLDSIHYICSGRTAFHMADSQIVRHKQSFFVLKTELLKNNKTHDLHIGWERNKRKLFRLDGKSYEKMSEHFGKFPCVLIAPYDTDLIREGNELRRKFFDSIIAQLDQKYFKRLIKYTHLLKHRNQLLKQFAAKHYFNATLLDTYDEQMIPLAQQIAQTRRAFITNYTMLLSKHYQNIAQKREHINLLYESEAENPDFDTLFKANRERDRLLQRSDKGTHKDKYIFQINDKAIKYFGSQGQQKSYIIALKLAQFEILKLTLGFKPLLLLDDIFEKLDQSRIDKLTHMIADNTFGQVFITDAIKERVVDIFQKAQLSISIIEIQEGTLKPKTT